MRNNKEQVRRISESAVMENDKNKFLHMAASSEASDVLSKLNTSLSGLSEEQVEVNRDSYGTNTVHYGKRKSVFKRIIEAFINPFTIILIVLAVVSAFTDIVLPLMQNESADPLTVIIICTMVLVSGILRFVQETRSGNAAERLLEMITTTTNVKRKGDEAKEIPLEDVVVGDIIYLSVGDMIPADMRILEAKDLFLSQSALTGASEPVERISAVDSESEGTVTDHINLAFMGSSVISGTARGVVLATGQGTLLGSVAETLQDEPVETTFTKGVNAVSWVLIRFMLVMVPIVFIINGITKGDWLEAFLFAISVAVGLTPEMLPMIVTASLAKGASAMSKKKTIVKNLNSIQNLGAMDILCTDKTGTLTQDEVVLVYHLDVNGNEDERILRHAFLNSYYQTGYRNLMDIAIIRKTNELREEGSEELSGLADYYTKTDEIPFDFNRRRLSVVVEDINGKTQMVTKGAVEEMLSICSYVELDGQVSPITDVIRKSIIDQVNDYKEDGMRVIAVAQKSNVPSAQNFSVEDENEMVLIGYLAFLDPPKETSRPAIEALREHGVTTKVLTGDNEKVARTICKQVGIPADKILIGADLDLMTDEELAKETEDVYIFAKLSPTQKLRIVTTLRNNGHTVGFLGDGINDAPAMKMADVSISVDNAVDIAKETADIILLEKDLMVLEEGIIEGRKTYANMIKYIKMTASSNFGNVFSVLAASALLPFLPMMSVHLIFLNLIYDLSCTAIPWDNVDKDFIMVPRKWDANSIANFMIWLGPTSSVFDWLTYIVMYFVFCPKYISGGLLYNQIQNGTTIASGPFSGMDMKTVYVAMFQAGWFIESMWSQTLVIHMIRTPKIPFIQSRASAPLTLLTFAGIAVATVLPYTGFGRMLGFVALPSTYFIFLGICIFLYMVLTTIVKKLYIRKYGELL